MIYRMLWLIGLFLVVAVVAAIYLHTVKTPP
jgi:hypothetical protein